MSSWLEIAVRVPVARADEIAAALSTELEAAAAGTEIRADTVVFWVEIGKGEQALAQTRELVASLARRGYAVDPTRVEATPAAPEQQWRDAWKKYFRTIRLTRQIVVVPSWDEHVADTGDLVVSMDPGQAFGTGDHATTRLMLEELQSLADAGFAPARVLDVGTGSGILAIAAAQFWPDCRVTAIDVDSLAISATTENCERNSVTERVRVSDASVGDVAGRFDLVLANIQAGILTELASAIADRAAERGWVVLSGLLSNQARGVGEAYAGRLLDHTLRVRASDHDPEWSVAVLGAK